MDNLIRLNIAFPNLHYVLLSVRMGDSGSHHVSISDGLHLVDIVLVDPVVEHLVEVVKEVDDLVGGADGADVGEADDVTEEDAGAVEDLGSCLLSNLEFLDNGLRKKRPQQFLRLLFLFLVDGRLGIEEIGIPSILIYERVLRQGGFTYFSMELEMFLMRMTQTGMKLVKTTRKTRGGMFADSRFC